jgi:hypothetical protein
LLIVLLPVTLSILPRLLTLYAHNSRYSADSLQCSSWTQPSFRPLALRGLKVHSWPKVRHEASDPDSSTTGFLRSAPPPHPHTPTHTHTQPQPTHTPSMEQAEGKEKGTTPAPGRRDKWQQTGEVYSDSMGTRALLVVSGEFEGTCRGSLVRSPDVGSVCRSQQAQSAISHKHPFYSGSKSPSACTYKWMRLRSQC